MEDRYFGARSAAVVVFLALAPGLACAYIDPGNGAYMVQALFTLMGAALFYIRHPIRTMKEIGRRCADLLKPFRVKSVDSATRDLEAQHPTGGNGAVLNAEEASET